MDPQSLSHLSDQEVLRGLAEAVAKQRAAADALLADAAEFEARGLELPPDVKEHVQELREERADEPGDSSIKLRPVGLGRYELQVEIGLETYEKLLYARVLLGDEVPDGDLGEVIDRAFGAFAEALEHGEDPTRE
jgi:hypothetical protein